MPENKLVDAAREFWTKCWPDQEEAFYCCGDIPHRLATFADQQVREAVKAERERIFQAEILARFKTQFRMNIEEGDFDFTKILEEVIYEGDTYADISDKGMDDVVSLATNALEMTLETVSEILTAKEIGGTDGTEK